MYFNFLNNITQNNFITNEMARERDISALSEEEYEIMLRKILGRFNTLVRERTLVEKNVLRKYYRQEKENYTWVPVENPYIYRWKIIDKK